MFVPEKIYSFFYAYRLIVACFVMILAAACVPTHFYTLEPGEIEADLNEQGYIPQYGTTIKIPMEIIHQNTTYCPSKMTPGMVARQFRYRVLVDGNLYSSAISRGSIFISRQINIPIMSNDSYKTKTIIIEGACATDYSANPEWNDWVVLYEGIQDCLKEGEPLHYSGLENKRLRINIDDNSLQYEFCPGSPQEVFKRILFDNGPIEFTCSLSSYKTWPDYTQEMIGLVSSIPKNSVSGNFQAGYFGLDDDLEVGVNGSLVFLMSECYYRERAFTPIGRIGEGEITALQDLVEEIEPKHSSSVITISLCD